LVNATSLRPLIRTRFGTDAEIDTVPVDVAPKVPCVAAVADVPATSAESAAADVR